MLIWEYVKNFFANSLSDLCSLVVCDFPRPDLLFSSMRHLARVLLAFLLVAALPMFAQAPAASPAAAAPLGDRDVHAARDFFAAGLTAELLHQLTAGTNELVDGFDHVHRDADRAGLVRNGAGNGLANPPRCISRKLVAAAILELVDGFHQADVAFLNEVEELEAAVGVLFGP